MTNNIYALFKTLGLVLSIIALSNAQSPNPKAHFNMTVVSDTLHSVVSEDTIGEKAATSRFIIANKLWQLPVLEDSTGSPGILESSIFKSYSSSERDPFNFPYKKWHLKKNGRSTKHDPHFDFRSWQKPAILVTAVATNWLSFYMKRKADDYYEKYKATSDVDKLERYYNRTKYFDTASNVFLGIATLTLSGYLYLLLTSD
ncbi:MAG: hypothetical protein GF313_02295 [Caldithrix sp.]|nr:hypothetical protein [Caldithrix sp.]